MPLVLADRVNETTTTTSTGTVTLAGAVSGYQSFAVIGNANTTYYTIVHQTANEWEVGIGTYTSSGTTLSRDTVLASSNSGSLVNFSAGTKFVFCDYPAGRAVYLDTATNVTIPGLTLSGGTANGVLYLNGSKVATSGTGLTFNGTTFTTTGAANFATSSGNVVVGATSVSGWPNGKLIVKQSNAGVDGGFSVTSSSNANTTYVSHTGTLATIGADYGSGGSYTPLTFLTGGSERMRLDSSGNLGLGVSPSAWSGATAIQVGSGSYASVSGSGTYGGAYTSNAYYNSGWKYIGSNNATLYQQLGGAHSWHTAASGTAGNTISFTQAMTLDASGQWLLGGTSLDNPQSWGRIAQVINSGSNGAAISVKDANNEFNIATYNSALIIADGVTERMRLDSSGNLGIGTSSPTVIGGYIAQTINGTSGSFTEYRENNSNTLRVGTDGGNGGFVFTQSTLPVRFGTNGVERVRITSTGLVGIGTSAPTSNGGSAAGLVHIHGAASGAWAINHYTNGTTGANAADGLIVGSIGADAYIYNYENSPIIFATNSAERMRLDSSGNLGLGVSPSAWETANSVRALQLNGGNVSSFSNAYIWVGQNWYRDSASAERYVNTAAATKYQQAFGAHQWFNAASGTAGNAISFTQAMTLDASGNLGVGTTSPGYRLDVKADGAGVYTFGKFQNANSTAVLLTGVGGSGVGNSGLQNNAIVWNTGNSAMVFGTNDTERARITSDGFLLVGTTNTSDTAGNGVKIQPDTGGVGAGKVVCVGNTTSTSLYPFMVYSTSVSNFRFYVDYDGSVYARNTSIISLSDARLKENIRDLDVGLDAVLALKPRKFDWKEGKGQDKKDVRGFIAQEIEEVFPDLVSNWADPAPEGEEPYKSVRQDLIPVLVKAIQEQQAMINDLKAKVAALESK
jgi:hypothetical protein